MAASSLVSFPVPARSLIVHNSRTSLPRFQLSLQPSPNPFHFQKSLLLLSNLKISAKPSSRTGFITSKFSPHKIISKFLAKKIATLLLGSFVVMGFSTSRLVLALPVSQESSQSQQVGEEKEAEKGQSEDEEMYVKLVTQNPGDVEALKMVVNLKMKRGKPKEAVSYVEKLIEVQPKEVEWRLLQALCYELMGQFSKAKKLFKEILKQKPLMLRALHGLAMAMHKNLEGPAVFEMLDKALELAKREKRLNEERNIRILVAQMHVVKGELEEALEKFQALVNENPRDFRPYLCQGIVYSLLDRKEEAKEMFEIYQSLVPEEFPQRQFLDDVVLAAKTESGQQLQKEFKAEFS